MNRKKCFGKLGAAVSGGAVLSSVVVPALTVAADELHFDKDNKELNSECNKSWLCWLYWVFRFDFVKDYVLKCVKESLAYRNFNEIYKLMTNTEGISSNSIGKVTVSEAKFGEGIIYSLSLDKGFKNFDLSRKDVKKGEDSSVLSQTSCEIDYDHSKEALFSVKNTVLTKRLYDSLVKNSINCELKNYFTYKFDFLYSDPLIQKGKRVSSIRINLGIQPCFVIKFYDLDGDFTSMNSSVDESEKVVNEIIAQLEEKNKDVSCNLNNISSKND